MMLLSPPESLVAELNRRWSAVQQAEANYALNATSLNLLVMNTSRSSLNKTLDKCSVELGRPTLPRPAVEAQEDGTLMLHYTV